jgi:hypothetical protein
MFEVELIFPGTALKTNFYKSELETSTNAIAERALRNLAPAS